MFFFFYIFVENFKREVPDLKPNELQANVVAMKNEPEYEAKVIESKKVNMNRICSLKRKCCNDNNIITFFTNNRNIYNISLYIVAMYFDTIIKYILLNFLGFTFVNSLIFTAASFLVFISSSYIYMIIDVNIKI